MGAERIATAGKDVIHGCGSLLEMLRDINDLSVDGKTNAFLRVDAEAGECQGNAPCFMNMFYVNIRGVHTTWAG
jgi:hypothetical protein